MRNHCARGTRQVCDSIAAYGIGFTGHGAMIWLLFNACPPPRRLSGRLLDFFGVSVEIAPRNAQAQSEPTKSDNRRTSENALMAISTRAEQKRRIAQAVLFGAMRQTAGVYRGQNAATETHRRTYTEGNRRDRNARTGVYRRQPPQQKRIAGRIPRANAATDLK